MYVLRQHVTETAGVTCTAYGTERLKMYRIIVWRWSLSQTPCCLMGCGLEEPAAGDAALRAWKYASRSIHTANSSVMTSYECCCSIFSQVSCIGMSCNVLWFHIIPDVTFSILTPTQWLIFIIFMVEHLCGQIKFMSKISVISFPILSSLCLTTWVLHFVNL
jgi:hypothetical protein